MDQAKKQQSLISENSGKRSTEEPMSYDPKCEELARHFLPSGVNEGIVRALAQAIQNFIEDEIHDIIANARLIQ
jgi:hypothetical protein